MKTIEGLKKCQNCKSFKFKWAFPLSSCPNCEYTNESNEVLTIKDYLLGLTTIYSKKFALPSGEFL